jgi:formate dehydrogenase subunit delta
MDIHNLIAMANRIGQFFESFSDREEALEGISNHLHKFWEPRMRRELLSHVDAGTADDLLPIVVSAIQAHRALIA